MADVLSTFAATALATFVPLYIGLFFPSLRGKGSRESLFFVAASVGIISWFFLDAIRGIGPGVAYGLHKFLEGLVVGAFAMLARSRYSQIGILGIASGLPTFLGFLLGLPSIVESTYFFALGASGAVYIEFKLI